MTKHPMAPLSRALRHRNEFIRIDDLSRYKRCRVQLHAQGVVLRDEVEGAEIRTKKQQVCRAGDFLVAEIDAKVGGYGIVPDMLDGAIVSSHYFLFEVDEAILDRRFLRYVLRTRQFQEQVEAQGSTNYAAIRPQHVLSYEVPLPPIEEQRRMVAALDGMDSRLLEAEAYRRKSNDEARILELQLMRDLFPSASGGKVGDWVRFQTGYAFKSEWFSDRGIRLARNVNISHGVLDWSEAVHLPESEAKGFQAFELQLGDILVSLDRPIISTGVKVARVRESDLPCLLLQRVARAQFQSPDILPDYFFHWLLSPHFVRAIDPGRSNGVPHISHKDIENIPFAAPSVADQRRAVAQLDALRSRSAQLRTLQDEVSAELQALSSSMVNQAIARQNHPAADLRR